MSSIPLRLNALGNVEISSASGVINHNSEVVHNHANDSVLADLKALKSSLANGDLFKWDGTNVVAQASSDFANASDLPNYVASADQYIQSVSAPLSVTANELSIDLNSYALASELSAKASQADLDTLQGVVDGKASQSALDDVVQDVTDANTAISTKLNSADQFIQSVAAPLSVSGSELSVDLSNYLTSADISDKLDTANLSGAISDLSTLEVGADAVFKHAVKQEKVKTTAYSTYNVAPNNEIYAFAGSDDKVYNIKCCAVYRKADNSISGKIEYDGLWIRTNGAFTVMHNSQSLLGGCVGHELVLENSAGQLSVKVQGSQSSGVGSSGQCSVHSEFIEC